MDENGGEELRTDLLNLDFTVPKDEVEIESDDDGKSLKLI